MYLKSIEVQGFKSFANKINFQFHNGITAIVGPNGSGKSNVADAVRWVLGEQKIKQLRGSSMQDVIFSGTEMRKPLSYAYVAITLDNKDHQLAIDYDEVTVARRLYRSGESEYLINGATCRLKDVYELFYDTGIGKEGYSIIGQGQIDKILSGKPEERRELFDEAAGIVKFKRRKAAAQKKLEDEKQNLLRVSDILSELEKQIGPLEKQSEKAKIYLKKKEELKTLDINMFLLENTRIREQLEKVEASLEIASSDLESSNKKYEEIKEEYNQIQSTIESLEEQIEISRNSLTDTSVMRGKLEGEIKVLEEQIKSATSNEEHLQTRSQSVSSVLKEREEEKNLLLVNKKQIDIEAEEALKLREEANRLLLDLQNKIESINNDIEAGKNTIINALNERATIKTNIGRFETMLEQANIRRAELTSKIVSVKSDEAKQGEILTQLEEEFQKVNDNISSLNDAQAKKEEELDEVRDNLTNLDKKLRDTQVLYHQEKSKLDALSNLTERYEGYGGSVKRVMEQKEHEKGIIGVVADIIKVDKKYETAIETALGGNIQNIVTDDEDTAKKMIAFLKKNKGGRATFLPLTSIKNPQEFKTPEVLDEVGVVGMADSLVTTEKRYADVAKAMLGRIVVIDNVDNAVKIAKKYDFELIMWGDMFFRLLNNEVLGDYYDREAVIPEKVRALIPDNVNLIYWDYYSKDQARYERNIQSHAAIKDNIWFAGGLWSWTGFAPHNQFSIDATTAAFNGALIASLSVSLAPRITRHGVLVEVYGEGIFITGDSGVGKSETAIELVKRGHRLIADDAVDIRKVSAKTLVGRAPASIRHYAELRGVGIIDICRIFGMGAVKESEKLDLVIYLEQWDSEKLYDRMGLETEYCEIMGINVPKATIPVSPGRNLAIIIEIAAMNNRQKRMGYNTAKEFNDAMLRQAGVDPSLYS